MFAAGQCLLKAKGGLNVTDHAGLMYLLADRNSGKAGTTNPFDHHRLQDWIRWVGSYLVVNYLMPESATQSVERKRPTPASRLDPQSSAKQSRSSRGKLDTSPPSAEEIQSIESALPTEILSGLSADDRRAMLQGMAQMKRQSEVDGAEQMVQTYEKKVSHNPEVQLAIEHIGGAPSSARIPPVVDGISDARIEETALRRRLQERSPAPQQRRISRRLPAGDGGPPAEGPPSRLPIRPRAAHDPRLRRARLGGAVEAPGRRSRARAAVVRIRRQRRRSRDSEAGMRGWL